MEGNTAWMLISTALVLFMVPGLALFYGGMVRSKNVLNMLNMNTYCLGIVPLVWVLVAFSLGNSGDGEGLEAIIGNLDFIGLQDVKGTDALIAVAFSMTFAAITPALIAGAVADRMNSRPGRSSSRSGACSSTRPSSTGSTSAGTTASSTRPPSTSPVVPRSTSTPVSPRSPSSWCSASGPVGPTRPCRRTTCPSSCSAPASSGSAGSASTVARRSPPTASPPRPCSTPSSLPRPA